MLRLRDSFIYHQTFGAVKYVIEAVCLFARNTNVDILDETVTGDETWFL
jgi:hypothetical protein